MFDMLLPHEFPRYTCDAIPLFNPHEYFGQMPREQRLHVTSIVVHNTIELATPPLGCFNWHDWRYLRMASIYPPHLTFLLDDTVFSSYSGTSRSCLEGRNGYVWWLDRLPNSLHTLTVVLEIASQWRYNLIQLASGLADWEPSLLDGIKLRTPKIRFEAWNGVWKIVWGMKTTQMAWDPPFMRPSSVSD
jgi:hypothetical protein